MAKTNNTVDKHFKEVNFDYLYNFAKENNLKITEISTKLGCRSSYISECKINGKMQDAYIRLMSALFNIDYDKLTNIKPAVQNQDTNVAVIEMIQKLSERVAILEQKMTQKPITVTEQEQIILLLQQMLKFGQCEERAFKDKAKGYGFSKELVDFAIDTLKLKREVVNGKVWLGNGGK